MLTATKIIIVIAFFSTLILTGFWAQDKLEEYWGDKDEES